MVLDDGEDSYELVIEAGDKVMVNFTDDTVTLDLSYQKFRRDDAGGIDLVNTDKLSGRPVRDEAGNITGTADGATLFPDDNPYQVAANVPGRLFLDIQYMAFFVFLKV